MSNSKAITAGVQSGVVIKTTSEGQDPDFANVTGLLGDCQYLRLKNVDGSYAYVALNEIDQLRAEMASKASTIDVGLMQSDIDDKATKSELEEVRNLAEANVVDEELVNTILSSIENKAEKSVVEGIAAELLTKADKTDVETLEESVEGKASQTSVDDLRADLEALTAALGGVTDENVVTAIENQINYLNNEINKRLTIDDIRSISLSVNSMESTVTELDEKVNEFESRLDGTASVEGVTTLREDVDELSTTVDRLETKISSKADKIELASRASHDELTKVATKVNQFIKECQAKVTELTDDINDINTNLGHKVGVGVYTTDINEINEKIDLKADKSVVKGQINQIESTLNNLKRDVDGLESALDNTDYQPQIDSINNSIKSINTKVNETNSTIKNINKEYEKISTWKDETSKSLKSQWVRVMSSKEYKALRPAGENTFQDYNPRYRYPNTVYLIVDFNRPKAIYIGDILVAQSEVKGSVGFAYTFPISF